MRIVCEADRERWLASIPALLPADNSAQVAEAREVEKVQCLMDKRAALLAQVAAIDEEVGSNAYRHCPTVQATDNGSSESARQLDELDRSHHRIYPELARRSGG